MRTVKINRGRAGPSSSFRRSSATCVSMVRVITASDHPHTLRIRSRRVAMAPRRSARATRSSNSFGASSTRAPAAGKPRLAEIYYRKSLEIEPANENAMAKLEELAKK